MPPVTPPDARRAASAAIVGLLLVAALLGPAGIATGVAGATPEPAPAGQTEPVENVTDDAVETATETIDDGGGTVDDTGDTVDDSAEDTSAVEPVDGTVDALENGTSDVTDTLAAGVNDTLEASGSLEGTTTGGDEQAPDATTGSGTGTTGTVQSSADPGAGPTPTQGGGLPRAAGGVAALGAATAAGATLLRRPRWPSALTPTRVAGNRIPGVELAPWLRWLAGLAGYSRYDDSDPLAHDTRAALHRRIEAAPGRYLSAIAETTDVPLSTARHHLRVLEDEAVVDTAMIRGRRCYFPASTEHQALAAAMADETQATVLSTLAEREWATVSEVADAIDVDTSTATYQLQRLAAADLVERERDGRAVRNRLAPRVAPFFEGRPAD